MLRWAQSYPSDTEERLQQQSYKSVYTYEIVSALPDQSIQSGEENPQYDEIWHEKWEYYEYI